MPLSHRAIYISWSYSLEGTCECSGHAYLCALFSLACTAIPSNQGVNIYSGSNSTSRGLFALRDEGWKASAAASASGPHASFGTVDIRSKRVRGIATKAMSANCKSVYCCAVLPETLFLSELMLFYWQRFGGSHRKEGGRALDYLTDCVMLGDKNSAVSERIM